MTVRAQVTGPTSPENPLKCNAPGTSGWTNSTPPADTWTSWTLGYDATVLDDYALNTTTATLSVWENAIYGLSSEHQTVAFAATILIHWYTLVIYHVIWLK